MRPRIVGLLPQRVAAAVTGVLGLLIGLVVSVIFGFILLVAVTLAVPSTTGTWARAGASSGTLRMP